MPPVETADADSNSKMRMSKTYSSRDGSATAACKVVSDMTEDGYQGRRSLHWPSSCSLHELYYN